MRKITEIRKWLTNLSYIKFIGLQTTIGLLIFAFTFATITIFKVSTPLSRFEGTSYTFIEYLCFLIFSAFVETLLFQYLPFIIFSHRVKNSSSRKILKPTRYILFSSVVFGLFHIIGTRWLMPLVVIRVLETALFGVVLSVSFYILHRKERLPILSVTLIHYLANTITVCTGTLLDSLTASL